MYIMPFLCRISFIMNRFNFLNHEPKILPDESISQIFTATVSDQNESLDIYGTPAYPATGPSRLHPSSNSVTSMSKSSAASRILPSFIIVTPENKDEIKDLLAVHDLKSVSDSKPTFSKFTWAFERSGELKTYWHEYDECIELAVKQPKVRCKHCRKIFAHPGRNGQSTTTSLKRHIESNCQKFKRDGNTSSGIGTPGFFQGFRSETSGPIRMTQEMLEEQILKFFISENIAFNQADNPHFRKLMSFITVNNKPASSPDSTTLRARLSKFSQIADDQLKKVLQDNESKISLALDCWSSSNKLSYLGTFGMEFRASL